jgi:hypothetical protein
MIGHNKPPRAEWESNPSGWIAVSRELRNHPIVGAGKPVAPADPRRGAFSRMEAWLDLLCLANYKKTRVPNRGQVMTLDVGQLVGSRRWLANRWNWSDKAVRHFLGVLDDEGMIDFIHSDRGPQTDRHNNIQAATISICNYSNYQLYKDLITDHVKRVKGPTRGPLGAHSRGPLKGPEAGPEAGAEEQAIAVACADGWSAKGPEQGPDKGPLPPPERGHILTSNNLKKEPPLSPTHSRRGADYWSAAMKVDGAYDPDADYQLVNGRVVLINGTRTKWADEFGGEKDLDLALVEASAYVQPSSGRPLSVQVEAQLARRLRDKRASDKRYEEAAKRNAEKAAKPVKPRFSRW